MPKGQISHWKKNLSKQTNKLNSPSVKTLFPPPPIIPVNPATVLLVALAQVLVSQGLAIPAVPHCQGEEGSMSKNPGYAGQPLPPLLLLQVSPCTPLTPGAAKVQPVGQQGAHGAHLGGDDQHTLSTLRESGGSHLA